MNVAIIGGGVSGMIAAIISKRYGNEVTVFEHMPRMGKKLILTGNGRCNLSNTDMSLEHFHSQNPARVKAILDKCPQKDTLAFFEGLGLYVKDRGGYLYPYSENASAAVDVLRFEIRDKGIDVMTETEVTSVRKVMQGNERNLEGKFMVTANDKELSFDRVIICAGSNAQRNTGSDGSGYRLAKDLGHTVIKPLPALTYLTCDEDFFPSIAGIRAKAKVSLFAGAKINSCDDPIGSDMGEVQLTKTGISGIPVFNVSHRAIKELDENRFVKAIIDFMPDIDRDDMIPFMKKRTDEIKSRSIEELLIGIVAKPLGICICKRCGLNLRSLCAELSDSDITCLCEMIKQFDVTVKGHGSFENAQVTQGGVSLDQVNDNLESRVVSGVFFAGEILDVHGDCGGYNLQWAASSAMVAAAR